MKKKIKWIQVRVDDAEHSHIKTLAGIYAAGNMSRYILYCVEAAPRKFLKKEKAPPKK